ncbi:MAG TPA: GtrA family protein [Acidocella sp.]|nr:GtrA family protein [Acidocella sp.]HQU03772.1 GtrA family protein [Acidocella sp.]
MPHNSLLIWLLAPYRLLIAIAARLNISEDFIRFGMVGTMGFCVDTITVYTLRGFIGLYAAGTVSFIVAASANWAVNRAWTFGHKNHDAMHTQWVRFLMVNLIGFIFNRGCFFTFITISSFCHNQPVYAIIAGSFAGLGFNYFLSKRFVFA